MAFDRQGNGLAITRVFLGVFFIVEGLSRYRWFTDTSILAARFHNWLTAAPSGSISRWYLEHVAIPGTSVFARLIPIGEFSCGVALLVGVWTSFVALLAFLLALNFDVASGALFAFSSLTSGYGLPVLGSTLGLAVGGKRLPWSIRG